MNVLYLVFESLLGGHVISAITISKEMKNRGVNPFFAGAEGVLTPEIQKIMPFEPVHIPMFHGTKHTYFTWSSLSSIKKLREIVKRRKIDLIHAFDAVSYMHAYTAGILERVPVLCTLCGGTDPYYNLPYAPSLIVFSEEQKQKMLKTFGWSDCNVVVLRTRLDLKQITESASSLRDDEALQLGLDPLLPKVMMISSFDRTKIRSIYKVLDAIENLYEQNFVFQTILIGGKGVLHEEAAARAKKINNKFEAKRVVLTGPVIKAFRLLQRAEIVLGVGRSAFEGMAYACPVLVVGEKGYAGTVGPEDIDTIAWYNFSGRNQKEETSTERLAVEISSLLLDKTKRKRLGEFGREFVFNEIDVIRGASRIASIYDMVLSQRESLMTCKQWLSFSKCLLPVMCDNGLHSIKERMKNIFQLAEI